MADLPSQRSGGASYSRQPNKNAEIAERPYRIERQGWAKLKLGLDLLDKPLVDPATAVFEDNLAP
jgi:hypothetical protein